MASETECANCQERDRLLNEFRAEVKSLRQVLSAVQEAKHRSGAMVELINANGRATWIVTAAETRTERLIADAVGQHIAKELGGAVRLTNTLFNFTGSSRDESERPRMDTVDANETKPAADPS